MSSEAPRGRIRRIFSAAWRVLDGTRRVVTNLVFLALVLVLAAALLASGSRPHLQEATTLVIDLRGDVVEQFTGSAREAEIAEAIGGEARETQLRDVIAVLDAAASDARIPRAVLLLDDMGHAGMAKLRELAAAMDRFKAAGKTIVAWGADLDQPRYYLAAHASRVYLHPFGEVALRGFGGTRNYYHDALERLGVTVNVFRVGRYKSAVEPFIANAPSREAQEADASWMGDAWAGYLADVEGARHLPAGALTALIEASPARVAAAGGDVAKLALQEKLVDELLTRDELRARLLKDGRPANGGHTFRQIAWEDYRGLMPQPAGHAAAVGVIVAAGTISDGVEQQGAIGGRSTSELIRRAREDADVKALVLRVDSPGGSAFGSELIRREIEVTRSAGKPVVISMGDVAASGGYWITTSADHVVADPATITGSIGAFSLVPTVDRTLDRLGVHAEGSGTTWLAQAGDLRRPLDPRMGSLLQSRIGFVYNEFLGRVGTARHLPVDKVDAVAQGRVWTGRQAHERGLVDELGGLAMAEAAAARLAKLPDGWRAGYIESEPHGWGRVLAQLPGASLRAALNQSLGRALAAVGLAPAPAALQGLMGGLDDSLRTAVQGAPWVHCLCTAP
jgi:protease-4